MTIKKLTSTFIAAAAIVSNTAFAVGHVDQQKCPFCQMPVLKDTATMDYRVTLTVNGKAASYRCVLCALAESKDKKGDFTIETSSEKKGHPVRIARLGGKWSVSPESAVFVYAEGDHEQCETRYRALTSSDAFKAYVDSNPRVLRNAKMLSLVQFLKLAG